MLMGLSGPLLGVWVDADADVCINAEYDKSEGSCLLRGLYVLAMNRERKTNWAQNSIRSCTTRE